jgi:hypothetical protein
MTLSTLSDVVCYINLLSRDNQTLCYNTDSEWPETGELVVIDSPVYQLHPGGFSVTRPCQVKKTRDRLIGSHCDEVTGTGWVGF